MKKKRFYMFLNGINTSPSSSINNWNDHAAIWIDTQTKYDADAFKYYSDTVFRRMFQNKRVKNAIDIIKSFSGFDIVLVGHSNGCDIMARILNSYEGHIDEIHMIAAACDKDCNKNGINPAIKSGRLGEVYLYGSHNDNALKKARWSQKLFGWMGLGYGDLGLDGPTNVENTKDVNLIWRDTYDHSTWWEDKNFEETMRLITHSI